MSKEGTRKCPDCDRDDYNALFGGKGDGNCSNCHGKGEVWSIGEGLEVFRLDIEKVEACKTCSGTGQCQTCGGTGYQYYDVDSNKSSGHSYREEISSSSYSGGDYFSSTDNKQYSQQSSGDSTLSSIVGLIVFIAIGAIIFENTCGNNSKRNNQTTSNSQESRQVVSQSGENKPYYNQHLLDGKWIKIQGLLAGSTNDVGLILSFENDEGTVIYVPKSAISPEKGQVLWKQFDAERNWIQVYVNLGNGYLNSEIHFIDANTIRINFDKFRRK